MKKTFPLIFSLFSFAVIAQDSIAFKVLFNPETIYKRTNEQSSETVTRYSGSDEVMQRLKEKDIPNPIISEKNSVTEILIKTEKLNKDAQFPLTMTFVKTVSSNSKKTLPDGTIIYGKCTVGKLPVLDSISSTGMNEDFKAGVLSGAQSVFSQLTFPDKKLAIGETFSREAPLTLPIENETLKITTITHYKLVKIVNGIASFDISQEYIMNSVLKGSNIEANGTGKGQILHDIANNCYLKFQIESEMKITVKKESLSIDMTLKSNFIQRTIIEKSKQ